MKNRRRVGNRRLDAQSKATDKKITGTLPWGCIEDLAVVGVVAVAVPEYVAGISIISQEAPLFQELQRSQRLSLRVWLAL